MKAKQIMVAVVCAATSLAAYAAKPGVIAHRGYWTPDGAAENSITSLQKADSIHVYGSEFDVWMTKDGGMVVYHDTKINGMEVAESTLAEICAQKLCNGENVPTLEEYLKEGKKLRTRLILEIKKHKTPEANEKAAKKAAKMVKKLGLEDRVEFITFSEPGMMAYKKASPETDIYYLDGKVLTPAQVAERGVTGIDYNYKILKKNPGWIKEAHDLGMKVNVWTCSKPSEIKWCIKHGVDYITTNEPELCQALINKMDKKTIESYENKPSIRKK